MDKTIKSTRCGYRLTGALDRNAASANGAGREFPSVSRQGSRYLSLSLIIYLLSYHISLCYIMVSQHF